MAGDRLRLQDLNNLLKTLKVTADAEYRSLIISIDIGTTYSGIGYIFTVDLDKVHVLDQWPSQTSAKVTSPKVPTVIKYGSGGPGFSWGYQVGLRDDKKLEAFKLLLDHTLPKPEYTQINKVQKNFKEFVKKPENAVNDFMGALYRYAIEAIEEKHSKAYSELRAVKFVVSTPAGWSDTVKTIMLQAANEIGISPVTHITEAEAAARFSLRSTEARAVGDTIMVCDAGGATTDLTTYTIRRLDPLQVVEFVPPLTRAGGALNLDKNFESHIMRNLLEEEEFIPLKKSPLYTDTLKQFDQEIKPVFTSSSTRQFVVKLKGTTLTDYPDGNLKNNTMIFDKKALDVIFLPVANTVSSSITEQINAIKVKKVGLKSSDMTSVDAVILTGGFGSNKYLREHLGNKFPSLKFIQPTNAWTAVIRGAAMSQAPSKKFSDAPEVSSFNGILNAKATASYGFSCCPIWDENNLAHRNEKRYWDSWEGVWRCKSINWIIKKGDDLRKTKKVALPCYKQCGPKPESDDFFIVASLEQSPAAEPPDSSTHASINTKKTIKVPLDSISDELFTKKTRSSDREPYWELRYDVVLNVSNGRIAFWVDIGGTQFGRYAVN
ncbi:uncharacterized protein PAC_16273 [Phialocephala subalpina]|uniref:SEA domain-containing protein n=1 Tax=Phialocephala subalpina TaxID=576137 RepID=A0A1L7XMV7_9HELO|nr:uncharacterized protein PAC_16273 [Phialocephala subalpina]